MTTSETIASRRVLSPRQCWEIAGVCKRVYQLEIRPHLSLVRISPRRVGHWSDELYGLLEARTEKPKAA
jgi:hypothetical protein